MLCTGNGRYCLVRIKVNTYIKVMFYRLHFTDLMERRTSLSLFLDGSQKKALMKHWIWSIDNIDDAKLEELTRELDIPRIIRPEIPVLKRNPNTEEYLCGIESIDGKISRFLCGCLVEICGLPGSGRTSLCLRYAKGRRTLWIDTEGCLMPPEGITLSVIRIHDHLQLFALIHKLPALVDRMQPELVVIDSVAAPIRGESSCENSNRTPLLAELARCLKVIAVRHGIPVLVTNHMIKTPSHGNMRTLGPAWASMPTHSFEVRKSAMGSRVLRVIKSPCLPRSEIPFE